MREEKKILKYLFALWLLVSCESAVFAYTQAAPPSAWRTTPTLSTDIQPNYQFRSTSTYAPVVGTTSYLSTSTTVYTPGTSGPNRAKKDVWDDEPGDDAIGNLNTPVGDPMILILFALAFILYKRKRATA